MNSCKLIIILMVMLITVTICSCFDSGIAGGGSSTGNANTLAGILVEPGTCKPAKCDVYLYYANRIPVLQNKQDTNMVASVFTDNRGRFLFRNIPDGIYNIVCRDSLQFLSKLLVNKSVHDNDSFFTGTDTLRYNTSLIGKVINAKGADGIAFIYGSPYVTNINDSSGFFMMNGIPSNDSLTISFKTNRTISGVNCLAEYNYYLSPDTSRYVTIVLECK